MKSFLLSLLLLVANVSCYGDDPYAEIYPRIESGQFSDHLVDQNVHFYYFSNCADDGAYNIEPFYHLTLEHSDICNIRDLLAKMSEKGKMSLLKNAKSLYSLGDKINRVHPVRFIGYIVSQHDLRKKLRKISESSFKWNHFAKGFGKRAQHEINNGNFYQYLPGFYDSLSHLPLEREVVDSLIHHRNWHGLLHYFISL
ncbi:hypothetical protein COB21_04825 [Candidatus Aerophobetes bacterium]|uniref:Uncharacterized protein n=1 Tax=Aerophobetes bacterium TaxID=2030807 RepID=A0A2A4X0B1_UNCAE|nr:MAG: hypothetical protein COB21_04825 [Candidatus Aerophobetes bacterium]